MSVSAIAVEENMMQRKSFISRFLVPVAIVLSTMVVTGAVYQNSWLISNDNLRHAVAAIFAVPYFLSIAFGASVVYPMSFFRGASPGERIAASLVVPATWTLKEIVRVSAFFTIGESIYFGLNQIFLLAFAAAFAQMGLCEIICRWRVNRRTQQKMPVLSAVSAVEILLGAVGIYVFFIWGWGVGFFYVYMQIYKALFQ